MPFISAVQEIQEDSFYSSKDTQDSLVDGQQDTVESMTK